MKQSQLQAEAYIKGAKELEVVMVDFMTAWPQLETRAEYRMLNSTPALETYDGSIPTGLNGTLLGIHIDDDNYLNFGVLPITVAGDDSFNIDVDYGTEAELVALVESLVN